MAQMTWRASDDLLERVKSAAERHGKSMNDFVTTVLDAVTDPDTSGSDAERIRERLAAAGLLASPGRPRSRPSRSALTSARRAASEGSRLSDLVSKDRGR